MLLPWPVDGGRAGRARRGGAAAGAAGPRLAADALLQPAAPALRAAAPSAQALR